LGIFKNLSNRFQISRAEGGNWMKLKNIGVKGENIILGLVVKLCLIVEPFDRLWDAIRFRQYLKTELNNSTIEFYRRRRRHR
jgi:hypothetical protein